MSLFVAQCLCLSLVWLVITIRTMTSSDNSDSFLETGSDTIVLCPGSWGYTFIMVYKSSEPKAALLTLCPP